ncbi:Vacuolar ATP synthase subunit C [Malassezia sp. CBS 17886]|nr:Vacuolar ATP synthase subunit C [Malassezia sp. CBS 17886]
MPSDTSYWIVSVPMQEEKSTEQMFHELDTHLQRANACDVGAAAPFPIPELKTGTLDSMITLSEDTSKTDANFVAVTTRIVDTLRALVNDDEAALSEHLMLDGASVDKYLLHWRWDAGRYRPDRPLPELVELLSREMQSIDTMMKQKLNAYNVAKGQLQQLERKKNGNLSVRSLADVVQRDDIVDPNSDFLRTLLVVVPRNNVHEWRSEYERLAPMVVPRSSQELAHDEEFALFTVTVFKKTTSEFMQKAREHKFQVRDFEWDEGALERERAELHEAGASEKELWTELVRLSRTNFADAFQALVHLKAIRTFVEAVLQFGLPARYFSAAIRPDARRAKNLVTTLLAQYGYLDEYISKSERERKHAPPLQETPGEYVNLLEQEVFPFVLTEVPKPQAQ